MEELHALAGWTAHAYRVGALDRARRGGVKGCQAGGRPSPLSRLQARSFIHAPSAHGQAAAGSGIHNTTSSAALLVGAGMFADKGICQSACCQVQPLG